MKRIHWFVSYLALFFTAAHAAANSAGASDSDSEVQFVLILSRHGVRAPLATQQDFGKYSAAPWPKWDVEPGNLTAHGRKQMELMGAYYRERYIREGLLSGIPAQDAAAIFFRANNDQRTAETARALAAALIPGQVPEIHQRPAGDTDPMFRPAKVPVGRPDRALGAAAVLGRVGGDIRNVHAANAAAFTTLQRILVGESGEVPVGKVALLNAPAAVLPGERENAVTIKAPLQLAGSMIDALMLEYEEGLPMTEVGWGRATSERISQLLTLHSLWFDLTHATPYCARVEGSNITSHVLATLEQAATGKADPAALGQPGQKMAVIVGHDTNQITLGSVLGLTWWVAESYRNPTLLGGALVFELRERRRDHQFLVRVYYVSPSLQQGRNLTPLTAAEPPLYAPIFIPDCSDGNADFTAPLAKFAAHARQAIDPQFVEPNPN
jgi:4-phytase / acid phosphatase